MTTEGWGRLRVILLTALATVVATLAGVFAVIVVVNRQEPPTPQLAPPKSITVIIFPSDLFGWEQYPPTVIPAGEHDSVLRLITPDQYFGQVHDMAHSVVAKVVVAHDDGPDTTILVRWTGKNPAAVTVDGRNYFYAESGPYDGAMRLIQLVHRLNEGKGQ